MGPLDLTAVKFCEESLLLLQKDPTVREYFPPLR